MLQEMLLHGGFEVATASNCQEARAAIGGAGFACALIDLGLPDGNGLDLLPELRERHPSTVPLILTGDGRAETIIDTMRHGAFDFLTKPFGAAVLNAAMRRAVDHHNVLRERDTLIALLSEEQEKLKAKVQEATQDLREYAKHCETVSARLRSLLRLTQISTDFYTDDSLFRSLLEELEMYVPVRCVVLCGAQRQEWLAGFRGMERAIEVVAMTEAAPGGENPQETEENLEECFKDWLSQNTPLEPGRLKNYIYPQSFWGQPTCTVAFFLSLEFEPDEDCDDFLNMCAHFVASEWHEARFALHATQQASLGNIALELSKSFIQALTAIRTASDVIREMGIPKPCLEALDIVVDNVETLRRQIQEFRNLSASRKDSVETVQLDSYIDQALAMLRPAILSRGIKIDRKYGPGFQCVLINGPALARTFLDLLTTAVRGVTQGGAITLGLAQKEQSRHLEFSIGYPVDLDLGLGALTESGNAYSKELENHPRFLMAQRTIRSCGGRLLWDFDRAGHRTYRIVLPRNAVTEPVKLEALH